MLLNPRKSILNERCKLKLNFDDTQPTKGFYCADKDCSLKRFPNIGIYYNTSKCDCGKSALSKETPISDPKTEDAEDGDCGVFTKSKAYFIITDDLKIFPSETGYVLDIFRSLGITGTDGTELRNVTFGFNEVIDLLRWSLLSPTPLTDLILNKRKLDHVSMKCETGAGTLVGDQIEKQTIEGKKMVVKVIYRESTNKLLLAEADGDFVEYLFTLLTIPLGAVECLLGGITTLKNIDNLYRSLGDINDYKYLKTQDTKTLLLEPQLPTGYVSKDKILPLIEESHKFYRGAEKGLSTSKSAHTDGRRKYVKEQTMYNVTDDLVVTPFCMTAGFSLLSRLKISLCDVDEVELKIGLDEALRILKASLTSTTALTDGLMNSISKKQPKQEH
ncbi:hypothetical protein PHJA_000099400 [Phtheirospermum japonicum]|uniref:Uncharacterized protein n=1 Tax=Phtheirospermum japonicum TaxID=374723 RepID=A0A830B2H5_9LAMI|nr:hypothetical protein PHJA_000099400 [Phtheirospermum japonicum]